MTSRRWRRVFAAWREGNSRAPLVNAALSSLRFAAATAIVAGTAPTIPAPAPIGPRAAARETRTLDH
jgi:hypothetical protein